MTIGAGSTTPLARNLIAWGQMPAEPTMPWIRSDRAWIRPSSAGTVLPTSMPT